MKYLIISIILVIFFKCSIDIYTILGKIIEYRYNWVYYFIFLFQVLFFAIIPFNLYQRDFDSKSISFDFKYKIFIQSFAYLLLLIAIHQMTSLVFDKSLHIPNYPDFRTILGYFSSNLLEPALIEELLYRGILYNMLVTIFSSKQKGMYVTAGIFGIMHYQFGLVFIGYSFIISVIFTKLYQKTDSLFYSTVLHGLLNLYL